MPTTPTISYSRVIEQFEQAAASFVRAVQSDYPQAVEAAAWMIIHALRQGKKLLIFGNGGSAADAQHFAGELVVRFVVNRRALPAIALGCDGVILTACGNDLSYEQIFSRQIEALGNVGDIAVAISTSGKSANVLHAMRTARDLGLKTMLFTGVNNGEGCTLADFTLAAPGANTARVQELHLASYHAICTLVDEEFSGVME